MSTDNEPSAMNNYKIASVMIRYGGSFVKHLGEALLCADEENAAKIQAAWPEYWQRYSEMAARLEQKEAEECDHAEHDHGVCLSCGADITDDLVGRAEMHRDAKEDA